MNLMLVGFSAGFLYREEFSYNGNIEPIATKIRLIKNIGCNAIELSGLRKDRFSQIKGISKQDLKDFEFVSFHAPKDKDITKALTEIARMHARLNFNLIVLHPDAVDDWNILDNFDLPFAVENMDKRKPFGQTVKDLKSITDNHDLSVVLDINHAYTNDKSLESLAEFYEAFGSRIKELHVSGFRAKHEPLVEVGPVEIVEAVKAIPNKEIPIIIESCCKDVDQMKSEYDFVVSNLSP